MSILLSNFVTAGDAKSITLEQAKENIANDKNLSDIPLPIWQQLLSEVQCTILWESATERPFSGDLLSNKADGVYVTAGCRLPIFSSETKFKSGTGWPSFWDVYDKENIVLAE
jgi:peptide-methionine (R)-S-oxide reductase